MCEKEWVDMWIEVWMGGEAWREWVEKYSAAAYDACRAHTLVIFSR